MKNMRNKIEESCHFLKIIAESKSCQRIYLKNEFERHVMTTVKQINKRQNLTFTNF